MFCNKCGAKLEDDAQFCSMCGSSVETEPSTIVGIPSTKNKKSWVAGKPVVVLLSVALLITVAFNIVQLVSSSNVSESKEGADEITVSEKSEYDELIKKATKALESKWVELYKEANDSDGYLEIYHTRVIDITPDATDTVFQEMDRGMEMDYIVEFSLYSDYFSTAPYYHDAGTLDTVIIYEDRTTSVADNFFRVYSNLTYSYEYSSFIKEITDLGSSYNRIVNLK